MKRRDPWKKLLAPRRKRTIEILTGHGSSPAPAAHIPYTGSLAAMIAGGRILIRGGSGQVDPDGALRSVGAGNGLTLTAAGRLSGNTGAGTFSRSDGCVGSWIAIKR
jgi:hypothetical protein